MYSNLDPYSTWGYAIEQDSPFYYIFGGGGESYDGFQYISTFLIKTDTLGNQLTFKNFSKEHAAYYASRPGALKKIHSGLFLAGSTLADTGTMGLLYLFNGECDTIFTKRFKGDGFTAFYNTDIINDTIYLIGATRDTLGSEVFLYLVALDTFGTTLWEQKIGNGVNAEFGLNVDHFTNGNLLLSGSVDYDDTGMVTDGKIYKTNRSGDPYFSKTYGTPFDDSHQYAKVSINNKSILVQQAIDTIINIGDVEYPRFVGKMDTSGNYIWRTFLNKPIFLDLWNLWENVDGTVVACGTTKPDSLENLHGFITKLDSNGIILWERTYTTDNYYDAYFFDVQQTPDKGFIISGSAVGDILGEPNQQMWLVKLDSMGCLEPGCADTFTSINPILIQNAMFTIYPNPISNTATAEIHIPENFTIIPGEKLFLNIYDLNGKLVDSYTNISVQNPNEVIRFNIYNKNLPSGIYEAALFYGGIKLGVMKLQYTD
ncbi:MAG: T9SS type A sorting domain-containing protein [Chitinophagales bacterium]|nr:T9SS type A sorting domain-containing protein [Bacteroidota bacterium]MBP8917479.1 T9SS type A sorting domain-containing protein [Chitinophagales bacterium]MBP9221544.1 T9SS type A sorting domain-containing protein [Chitinophagales bacterium]MBP9796314.1 T9SS type A sorting domain-containing protein [Chitinophagales bacterium]